MNANLERLIALQIQDLEVKRLREALLDAPKRVAAAELLLKKSQAGIAAAKDALKKEEVLRRSLENDVNDRRGKIARLQKQMESATSAAQITSFEHEIAFAENAIAKFEDDELASMERSEQQDALLAKHTAAEEENSHALTAERERSARSVKEDTAALDVAQRERAKLRPAIDEGLLAQYDRVAKARATGVSEAVDGKCSACQMKVRAQRWNDLTGAEYADNIFTCETCGRMLWYDPRRNAPTQWKPGTVTEHAS